MAKPASTGICSLCGGTFRPAAMKKHLETCPSPSSADALPAFHVFVQGRDAKNYWMHLSVPQKASLAALDQFLRATWLECCGHLSGFRIGQERYSLGPEMDPDEKSMKIAVSKVLAPGLKFEYEYDYGSTTELILAVLSVRPQSGVSNSIQILARNDQPKIPCDECGDQLATQICSECAWNGKGWLCPACGAFHHCGEEMLLPVVNSPRVGVCVYSGKPRWH